MLTSLIPVVYQGATSPDGIEVNVGQYDVGDPDPGTASAVQTGIAVSSNGASLPQSTINVLSSVGFPTSGTLYIVSSAGVQAVTYTGVSSGTFTGCSGGTGTLATSSPVTTASLMVEFPDGEEALWIAAVTSVSAGKCTVRHSWITADTVHLGEHKVYANIVLPDGVHRTSPRIFAVLDQFDVSGPAVPARGPCKVSTVIA